MSDNNGLYPWMDEALCHDPLFDKEWWFADITNDHDRKRAVKVCGMCYVREQCLELGMEHSEGIWGGLTPQQRKIRKRTH